MTINMALCTGTESHVLSVWEYNVETNHLESADTVLEESKEKAVKFAQNLAKIINAELSIEDYNTKHH